MGTPDPGDVDPRDVDPVTAEVVRNGFISAATEMKKTLVRTAHHSMIYETQDFGISVYDRNVDLVADAPGLAMFLGANDYSIGKGLDYVGRDDLDPGDVVFMNYPYWSSRHQNDGCLFAPVYVDGEAVAYSIVRAHLTDMGAKDPAYVLDSTDVHQEGVIFPGNKVHEGGTVNEEFFETVRFNSRAPETVLGDINAEIAALETGRDRIEALYDRHGVATVERSIAAIVEHGRRTSVENVEALPDGSWSAEEYVDNDGVSDDLLELRVDVTIDGDRFEVDFSRSPDQVAGPVNVPIGMTEGIAKLCFKRLTTPDTPTNEGHYEPLSVVAPEGSVFNATYPAPTYTITGAVHGVDLILKALGKAMPDRVPASSGSDLGSVMFYGTDPETGRMITDGPTPGIGWGASAGRDGGSAIRHPSETTTRNVPVEVLESTLPVRFDRVRLRTDSGGPGAFRGGLGVRRDLHFTRPFNLLSLMSKTRTEGWGLEGGRSGATNAVVLGVDWSDGAVRDRLDPFVVNNDRHPEATDDELWTGMVRGVLQPDERLSIRTGGGGGYGAPFDREPERVREDVRDGYVSREAARRDYGVVLTDDLEVDRAATAALRDERDEP